MHGIGAILLSFPKKLASQDFYKSSDHVELPPNSVKSYYPLSQSGMGIQSFFSHKAIVTPLGIIHSLAIRLKISIELHHNPAGVF